MTTVPNQPMPPHRYFVKGHWRKQWFPKLGVHKNIWVKEHIVGPEDLPLIVKDFGCGLPRNPEESD